MKKKGLMLAGIVIAGALLGSCGLHFSIRAGTGRDRQRPLPEDLRVRDLVIGNPYGIEEVCIKENGSDVPYLVLSRDYGGSCLLMRKEVLDEKMRYSDGPAIVGNLSAYYPGSKIDRFLSGEFTQRFSQPVRELMVGTDIEVYTKGSLWCGDLVNGLETEKINRRCFLLSYKEWGVNTPYLGEGKRIAGIEDYQSEESCWLRSAYVMEQEMVWMVSKSSASGWLVSEESGLRPVFCVPPETEAVEEDGIVRLRCESGSES
ncbi:MAG: hypothetical protein IJ806_05860 [Ruminococcus sp.]|nr:hypothetical protein [Ruminococcus sp.]